MKNLDKAIIMLSHILEKKKINDTVGFDLRPNYMK